MSSWREKEAEYQAVHSFIQSVENEIDEVLRGQGKRKSRESPPPLPPCPPAFATDSHASKTVSYDSSQSQNSKECYKELRPSKQNCYDSFLSNIKANSDENSKSQDKGSNDTGSESKSKKVNIEDTDRAKEFERRKAAICFGPEDATLSPVVSFTSKKDNSEAFEFLEDSAFADNLYATVISPLEKKRSKHTEQLPSQSSQLSNVRDTFQRITRDDAINQQSPNENKESRQPHVSGKKDKDSLLESLLTKKGSKEDPRDIATISDRNCKLDDDQINLPQKGSQNKKTTASSERQPLQSQANKRLQKHHQRQHNSPPPPPPKRTSSIRKCQVARQSARGPVQITKSPTSIEKLQHRLIQNRQNSNTSDQEVANANKKEHLVLNKQHIQRSRSLEKAQKPSHSSSQQQNIPVLKGTTKPNSVQRQHSHGLNQCNKQLKHQLFPDHSPHSFKSEAEKAQKEREARLLQIYEDVKKISRPSQDSSLGSDKTFPSPNNIFNQSHQKQRPTIDYLHHNIHPVNLPKNYHQLSHRKKDQLQASCPTSKPVPQEKRGQTLRTPQHRQLTEHHRDRDHLNYDQRKTHEQFFQGEASSIYENVDFDSHTQFSDHHQSVAYRSPHSQNQSILHAPRALSDHVTNIPRPSLLPRPPRRFSDSETYSDLDASYHGGNAISSSRNQILQGMNNNRTDAGVKVDSVRHLDSSTFERYHESDSAPTLCFSPPPILSFGLERRLSDTALYSSQFSDIDEMTSSMEEAMIVTPPPEFMNEPEDPVPGTHINKSATLSNNRDEIRAKSSESQIPQFHKETRSTSFTKNSSGDASEISLDLTKENRTRNQNLDSTPVSKHMPQKSPKSLLPRGPPACRDQSREMPGSFHLRAGVAVCQATQDVALGQTQRSEGARVQSQASSSGSGSILEMLKTGVREPGESQDLDIAELHGNVVTNRVPTSLQKSNFRSSPDGAPDKNSHGNLLSWSLQTDHSRLKVEDSSLVLRSGVPGGLYNPLKSPASKRQIIESQSDQLLHHGSSGYRYYRFDDEIPQELSSSSKQSRTRPYETNSTSIETQVRSFGTDPKTPVFKKKESDYSDHNECGGSRGVITNHMGNNQSLVKSPKGEISLCGVGHSNSINGNTRQQNLRIPHQETFPSSSSSQDNNNKEGPYDKKRILNSNGSHKLHHNRQNGESKAHFQSHEANMGALDREQSQKKSQGKETAEERKIMLRDTAVQTSLELDGYAVDISSSLEDLHDSVMNDSKISEIETSGELVQDKETSCVSYKVCDDGELNRCSANVGQKSSDNFHSVSHDGVYDHRQNFGDNNTFVKRGENDTRVSRNSNKRTTKSPRPLIVRSKSLHSDAGATVKDKISQELLDERKQRENNEGSNFESAPSGGSANLSGSLRELRHLNIDVSQRLVDGEKRFVVVNGGSPDLQVVVNSLTPVLSRRKQRSGGNRRMALAQNLHEREKRNMNTNHCPDTNECLLSTGLTSRDNLDLKSYHFDLESSSPALRGTFFEGPNQEIHFSSNSNETFESLPIYLRLRSHDGAIEHTISQDPHSPRKLTEDDFAASQNKKKALYQVSKDEILAKKKEEKVFPADHVTRTNTKPITPSEDLDSYPNSGKVWKSEEIQKTSRNNILNFLSPETNDLANELEKSRQSLFLRPKLAHTWHGPTSESMSPGYRQAPRMGLGVYFQEAALRGRLPFMNTRNTRSSKTGPVSAEDETGVDQHSSYRHSQENTSGYFHGHTLPVISRTLLDAMHKRYCSHQYSPTLMQHLQPCSAHTIRTSPTTSQPGHRPFERITQAPPVTALRVEPPVNPSTKKVQTAPPSPQVIAKLKQILLEHHQKQQQQQQQNRQQLKEQQNSQILHHQHGKRPDGHTSRHRGKSSNDNIFVHPQNRAEDHEIESKLASGQKHQPSAHVGISSLPPHVKARFLAVAQSQGHVGLSADGKRITEVDLEPSPSVIRKIQSAYKQQADMILTEQVKKGEDLEGKRGSRDNYQEV